MSGRQISDNTGVIVGQSATDTVGFYGTAAVAQPTNANEAAVTAVTITTAATTTTPAGYSSTTQANAIASQLIATITLVNQLRSDLVTLGLIKGS